MQPLIVLIVVSLAVRLIGWVGPDSLDSWPTALAIGLGLAAMFALTASAHFTQPRRAALIATVPPSLPGRDRLVDLTGVLEIAGVVGLLLPATRPYAAGCLFVLLVLMFPANVSAARRLADTPIVTMPLPARTLTQGAFLTACALVAIQ
jgi:uncharacterized membrane protein